MVKIRFTCWSCRESFQSSFENIVNKTELHCPDCGDPFPEAALSQLSTFANDWIEMQKLLKIANQEDDKRFNTPYTIRWTVNIVDSDL